MSQADEGSNGGFATAVAAATYAISHLEREGEKEGPLNKKKPVDELQVTSTKTKSRKERSTSKPTDPSRISRWFSGMEEKQDEGSAAMLPSFSGPDGPEDSLLATLTKTKSKKESSTEPTDVSRISRWFSGQEDKKPAAGKFAATEKTALEDQTVYQKKPGKEIITIPSIKKTATFADKHQHDMGSKRYAGEKGEKTGPNASTAVKTTTSLTDDRKLSLTTLGEKETKADDWEKAKIAKIKRRHEKLCARILEWENEKKNKARIQSERIEGKLELRRAIASQEYRNDIAKIDKIVAQARAAADEKRRHDERKTMEKANEIRSTGKIPHECCCI